MDAENQHPYTLKTKLQNIFYKTLCCNIPNYGPCFVRVTGVKFGAGEGFD